MQAKKTRLSNTEVFKHGRCDPVSLPMALHETALKASLAGAEFRAVRKVRAMSCVKAYLVKGPGPQG